MKIRKFLSLLTTAALSVSALTALPAGSSSSTISADAATSYNAEYLNRGITAVNTGSGMLVSWRFLADDDDNAVFKLYRNNTLIYTSNSDDSTCYLDSEGTSSSEYRVDTVVGGTVTASDKCTMISNNSYFEVPFDQPAAGSDYTYSPNDCSVGDVDGDGTYELFVKWDPSNSKDNSQSGVTGNVYIDCYKLDGTKLWRIDLGVNIRAGAHYTQFLVADFDSDGYAEMTCKTADGTIDGTGKVIGDGSKDYRNSSGYILDGPEYYTLFDGLTGAALDTVDYNPQRGTVSKSTWGDAYGNRVDRFLGAVVYLDGVNPSAVTVRGYYTRMTACAYDVVNKKLVQRWYFDTGYDKTAAGYADGNHNCMPADVDGDGKQELVLGATCLDDDGTVLWCNERGHGDAMHLGDFLPDRPGLELWVSHEESPYGNSLIDAATGEDIFYQTADGDTGRACADNIWAGNDGAEFWSSASDGLLDGNGNTVSTRSNVPINFLSYWDGDLERELLDGYAISKYNGSGVDRLLTATGCSSNNSTKSTPCLSADIFGDWREEVILRTDDNTGVRIYCTTYDTDYRITTLMHDIQYRCQVAGQNIAYNQPPHTSFYLGSDQPLPSRPTINVLSKGTVKPTPSQPAVLNNGGFYTFKNVNSGLYMEVSDGTAAKGQNIQQGSEVSDSSIWRVISAGDGYYKIYSQVGDKTSYLLDITAKKSANGTNVELYTASGSDAQLFKFIKNDDGSYTIRTKVSGDASCIEVANADSSEGANVQEWELNSHPCQSWILEETNSSGSSLDESTIYMFKNANSGLYLEVEGGTAAAGTNVQQWGADSASNHNSWTVEQSETDGYYYIVSRLGDGKTYYLDVSYGLADSGTNIQIYTTNRLEAQRFKFIANPDGTYSIVTMSSDDKCAVETADSSTSSGANIQQGTFGLEENQKWIIEEVGKIEIPYTTGDLNSDELCNVFDLIMLKRGVANGGFSSSSAKLAADINGDGNVDVLDVTELEKFLSNK